MCGGRARGRTSHPWAEADDGVNVCGRLMFVLWRVRPKGERGPIRVTIVPTLMNGRSLFRAPEGLDGGGGVQMHFFASQGGGFFCIFLQFLGRFFFGLCLAFSLLLFWQSMDKFMSHAPFFLGGGVQMHLFAFFASHFLQSQLASPLRIADTAIAVTLDCAAVYTPQNLSGLRGGADWGDKEAGRPQQPPKSGQGFGKGRQ